MDLDSPVESVVLTVDLLDPFYEAIRNLECSNLRSIVFDVVYIWLSARTISDWIKGDAKSAARHSASQGKSYIASARVNILDLDIWSLEDTVNRVTSTCIELTVDVRCHQGSTWIGIIIYVHVAKRLAH
ncbi:MAG: hypothetical protein DWP92_06015 [Armatimonadetes bacterium]|nr:MAG: hypothetical protein DWP92_06015 [Armatimonadota bacterium]